MKQFRITTKVREGIRDIEGEAVTKRLQELEWQVAEVRMGQVFYVEAESSEVVDKVCSDHLVNTILYDYEVEDLDGFNELIEYQKKMWPDGGTDEEWDAVVALAQGGDAEFEEVYDANGDGTDTNQEQT